MMGDDFLEPLDQNFEGYLSLALFSNRFFEKGDALVVTTKTTTRMHSDLKLRILFKNYMYCQSTTYFVDVGDNICVINF